MVAGILPQPQKKGKIFSFVWKLSDREVDAESLRIELSLGLHTSVETFYYFYEFLEILAQIFL